MRVPPDEVVEEPAQLEGRLEDRNSILRVDHQQEGNGGLAPEALDLDQLLAGVVQEGIHDDHVGADRCQVLAGLAQAPGELHPVSGPLEQGAQSREAATIPVVTHQDQGLFQGRVGVHGRRAESGVGR